MTAAPRAPQASTRLARARLHALPVELESIVDPVQLLARIALLASIAQVPAGAAAIPAELGGTALLVRRLARPVEQEGTRQRDSRVAPPAHLAATSQTPEA